MGAIELTTKLAGCVLALALIVPGTAPAVTFPVNQTGDEPDASLSDGPNVCDVATGTPGEQCTLRAAMEEANFTAGADEIHFAIPGSGVQTIAPATELPALSGQVLVDGLTQPGAAANTKPSPKGVDAELLVQLRGDGAPPISDAFDVLNTSPGTIIRGLIINRFSGTGIVARAPTTIEGNFIGTNAAGTRARPMGFDGVFGSGGQSVIGGTSPEARNLISGNGRAGITTNPGLVVQGNLIGTAADGKSPLGNAQGGLVLAGGNNTVGGPASPNVIAHNGLDGIELFNVNSGSLFSANRIYANEDSAIDLGSDGKTPNDELDADTGANGLQNFPVLKSARTRSGETKIKGKLGSTPSSAFTVELFSNASGAREGRRFLGQKSVNTDADGDAGFTFRPERKLAPGTYVSATATAADDSTSEFSKARKVKPG